MNKLDLLQRLREEHATWQPIEGGTAVLVGDMAVVEITALDGPSANQPRTPPSNAVSP